MSVMKKIKLGNGEVTGSGEALGKGGRNLPKEREVALRRPRRRAQRVQSLRGGKVLVEPEAGKEAGEAAASRPGQGRAQQGLVGYSEEFRLYCK